MLTHRVFNFSAGPAALPVPVLEQAAAEMLNWRGSGMSVMEMSHRGKNFMGIAQKALDDLRELLNVPVEFEILFVQGGGLAQNALIPLNLLRSHASGNESVDAEPRPIDVLITGAWSKKSAQEAGRYARVNVVADAANVEANGGKYRSIPDASTWQMSADAAYFHVCTNETIDGVEFQTAPFEGRAKSIAAGGKVVGPRTVVADMSSHILSRAVDIQDYDCIFAGAQKNIGPAGLTIVIVRKSLLGRAHPLTPSAFDFSVVAQNGSMYNTPPTYSIYIAGLVFEWLKKHGGVAAMEARNVLKAERLYTAIDGSSFYENNVAKANRSRMNVPFFLKDESRNDAFLAGAQKAGLTQLKGHRLVGGMRASIYNAMPIEGVDALISYMRDFEKFHA